MRVIITNITGRRSVYIEIADWFAEKESLKQGAEYIKETEKAVLLDFGDKQCWIPKSLFTAHVLGQLLPIRNRRHVECSR